tara:strand:+ start:2560 stop:3234 length:675 start_codon:yes stop_codon:yes gene_type:complete
MNKMPSLRDVTLGKSPVVKEGVSQAFSKSLTLANVLNLAGQEIDELTKWKAGPGAAKQQDPERAYSDERDVLGPGGEPTGERFPSDAGVHTVDPERTADPSAKIPGNEFEESEGDVCPHCGAQTDHGDEGERIKDPDEKEMEDAEADDTLQYTGVGGDDVEEYIQKKDRIADLGSGFDFGGGKDFLSKPKGSVHDEPGGFTGNADKAAYKDMMKMPKKQSGFGF